MLLETKAVTLKTVAERVGLAPCSVSAILNNTEASRAIPQRTKDRVYRAASELNYRPNYWARSYGPGKHGWLLSSLPASDDPPSHR